MCSVPGLSSRAQSAPLRPLLLLSVPARDGERWSLSAAGPAVLAGPGVPQLPSCHRAGARPRGPRPADQRQPQEARGDRL